MRKYKHPITTQYIRAATTKPKYRNLAVIRISEEILLDWLDFSGGRIIGASMETDHHGEVNLIVEHRDLPSVNRHQQVLHIVPSYKIHSGGTFEREYPPKTQGKKKNT